MGPQFLSCHREPRRVYRHRRSRTHKHQLQAVTLAQLAGTGRRHAASAARDDPAATTGEGCWSGPAHGQAPLDHQRCDTAASDAAHLHRTSSIDHLANHSPADGCRSKRLWHIDNPHVEVAIFAGDTLPEPGDAPSAGRGDRP